MPGRLESLHYHAGEDPDAEGALRSASSFDGAAPDDVPPEDRARAFTSNEAAARFLATSGL